MMVPHLDSVVFYYKTTMWSCLSGTACPHVCSRISSCFGACYLSSIPENLTTSSRRFVLQTFIFLSRLDESGISWHQPDLNLGQIWWLELFQDYDVGPERVDVLADTPSRKIYHCSILIELFNHLLHEDFVWLILVVVPYGFLCSRSPTFLLDVLDIKPYLWVDYTSTSRRTLEAEC